jgi:hypothetical protein
MSREVPLPRTAPVCQEMGNREVSDDAPLASSTQKSAIAPTDVFVESTSQVDRFRAHAAPCLACGLGRFNNGVQPNRLKLCGVDLDGKTNLCDSKTDCPCGCADPCCLCCCSWVVWAKCTHAAFCVPAVLKFKLGPICKELSEDDDGDCDCDWQI